MDLAKRLKIIDTLTGLAIGAAAIILLGIMFAGLLDGCVDQVEVNAGAARQHLEGQR